MFPAILTSLLASAGPRPATVWMPPQASTVAAEVDFLFNFINWICYVFFVLIAVLLVYFVWKYRRSPENHAGSAQGPTHNTALELTWTGIPLALVIAIFYLGFRGYVDLAVIPRNAYEVEVTAKQWSWSFKYPNGATSNDLYVPKGTPVKLVMRSDDVIHSLFIPDFRVKKDVVPGRYTYLWFEAPYATGDARPEHGHHLFCTEYCGTEHSNMNRRVYVLEQAQFDEWVDKQARWIDEIDPDELYFKAGPRLFVLCSQCHSIDGRDGNGPSWGPRAAAGLGNIWERTRDLKTPLVGGRTLADIIGPGKEYGTPEDYLRDSIVNPARHLVAGYGNAMPTFRGQLNDKKLDALVGMMKRIDEFNPDGSWKGAARAAPAGE